MGETMKVAAITGQRRCEVVDRPRPHAAGAYAVVKVLVAPMCTEYKGYRAGRASETLGHEAAGEVVEVAREGRVSVGDRVAVMPQYPCGACELCTAGDYIHCRNNVDPLSATGNEAGTATYAQYVIKPDWLLVPLPQDVSFEHGSMACCGLGPTFQAVEAMAVDAFDTVLVTGLGPVGLGGVINARCRGARVIGVEGHPYRAALAERLGAEAVLAPGEEALAAVLERTGGRGVDAAIDCSGAGDAQRLCIDAARWRGQVAFVGQGGEVGVAASRDMIRKGLTLRGIWHWNLALTARMLATIRRSGEQLDRLITHRFGLGDIGDAWELQITGECGKVLLEPWR